MPIPVPDTLGQTGGSTFGIVDDSAVVGGLRVVATTADRDAIPAAVRKQGMLVFVYADDAFYKLLANLTDWQQTLLGGPVPGYHLWLDPADNDVVVESGGLIDSITDKGSSGAILAGSGATRMTSSTLNGKRCLYSDTIAKRMRITNKNMRDVFTQGAAGLPASWTLFIVVAPQSVLSAESWAIFSDTPPADNDCWNQYLVIEDAGGGNLKFGNYSFSRAYLPETLANNAAAHVFAVRFRCAGPATFLSHWVDGVMLGEVSPQPIPGDSTWNFSLSGAHNIGTGGAGQPSHFPANVRDAKIGDIVLYGPTDAALGNGSGALSDADMLTNSQRLMAKWGI